MEEDTILIGEDKKPVISEELCSGCGICVNRCVFNAINIINLPEILQEEPIHRYGQNSFELFGMPTIEEGRITWTKRYWKIHNTKHTVRTDNTKLWKIQPGRIMGWSNRLFQRFPATKLLQKIKQQRSKSGIQTTDGWSASKSS